MVSTAKFQTVEVGNWYTEYQCMNCKKYVVINDDDDNLNPEDRHTCPSC